MFEVCTNFVSENTPRPHDDHHTPQFSHEISKVTSPYDDAPRHYFCPAET